MIGGKWDLQCSSLTIEIFIGLFCFQRDKVEAFVSKVNGAMRVRHELEKLKTTADRIHNNYNVVEAVNEEMEKVSCDQDLVSSNAHNIKYEANQSAERSTEAHTCKLEKFPWN